MNGKFGLNGSSCQLSANVDSADPVDRRCSHDLEIPVRIIEFTQQYNRGEMKRHGRVCYMRKQRSNCLSVVECWLAMASGENFCCTSNLHFAAEFVRRPAEVTLPLEIPAIDDRALRRDNRSLDD